MKRKLTLTVEENLLPLAKRYAKSRGLSLSSLVERLLMGAAGRHEPSFASRWLGKLQPAERGDVRYDALEKKYLR